MKLKASKAVGDDSYNKSLIYSFGSISMENSDQ